MMINIEITEEMNKSIIELGGFIQKINGIAEKYDISRQRLFSEWAKCTLTGYTNQVALLAVEIACATIRADKENDYLNAVDAAQQVLARMDGVDLHASTENL